MLDPEQARTKMCQIFNQKINAYGNVILGTKKAAQAAYRLITVSNKINLLNKFYLCCLTTLFASHCCYGINFRWEAIACRPIVNIKINLNLII